MAKRNIRVTPRPHSGGIDIDKLALALLEVVKRVPASQLDALARAGDQLIARAERDER